MEESIILGGGCFWCVEAVYELVEGVSSVQSGYAGGRPENANYRDVCSGMTRHAEVIKVNFNPDVIDLGVILDIFWTVHDPTTPNQQGNDKGPQYRSIIFYENESQKEAIERSITEVAPTLWDQKIVTEVEALEAFYPAETYHNNYYQKTGNRNPYCTYIISPKVAKFRKHFADRMKKNV